MRAPQWLRPPRLLLLVFVGTMLSFLAGLGYLGWESIERNRDLEERDVLNRLTRSADLITSAIRRKLSEFDSQLERLSRVPAAELDAQASAAVKNLGSDALLVVFELNSVRAYPMQRLLYRPAVTVPDEPDPQVFVPGEVYENQNDDYFRASLYFRDLADNEDAPDIRAGALYRLARNQRKSGLFAEALATYGDLERLTSAWVLDVPADLFARTARADLLKELGRLEELTNDARRLDLDLHSGRWPLTRSQFLERAEQIQGWLPGTAAAQPRVDEPALALASSVEELWGQWQRDAIEPTGRGMFVAEGRPMLRLWRGTDDRFLALVGSGVFLKDQLIDPLNTALAEDEVGIVLSDPATGFKLEHALPKSGAPAAASQANRFDQVMGDTTLPWNLRVVSAKVGTDETQYVRARIILVVAISILSLLVVTGSYFSGRAITREMEAARLQSDFVAAVSHEFRTPLTLLRQFSDLLADGRVSSDEERHQYYAALQRGTRRLTRLVEDLLDFGRMEAGSHGFRFSRVDPQAWITRVVSDFRDQFRGQGYEVELDWHVADEAVMHADEAAVSRALWNLLDNAVKYSPSSKTVWVNGTISDGKLIVSVRDRGIGVSPGDRRAIFRKFVRGTMPEGSVVRGTGLGLALVEQIMQAHGGEVRLDSSSPEGSTFSLVLPVTVPASALADRGHAPAVHG